ncbi:bcl-2-like protein 10 isoform X2 [Heterocephalus glaber]|uniref:Bcl-2-like protein 10 isoform X2 n=1 Tax=Heterocephalus glaber TaxID=10181 RepID=A0AAX6NSD0_HETGA|nr:bcl-2-like protein 10 isoform X2 [Heterocephalus glaber]
MGDPLWTRTEQLFADYLQFCARDPGTNGLPPRTPEAALLRTAAQELLRGHGRYFARYRDYGGNRAELLEMLADAIVPDDCKPTWLRVVTLATLAGTLLEHPGSSGREKVARDCRRMVARLCARFVGRHRAWLEAQGDWDGFCQSFSDPLPMSYWRGWLAQSFVSCILATVLIYLWSRVYRFCY